MVIKGKRRTGQIIPRTYGLLISTPSRDNVFVSPLSYAIAQIKMESPREIRARLADWGHRHNYSPAEVEKLLTEEIGENKEVLLNYTRTPLNRAKPTIKDVRHRGEVFTGKVVSGTYNLSKGNIAYHDVSFRHPSASRDVNIGFSRGECDCGDARYNGYKKKSVTAVCSHMAALEIALSMDVQSRVSVAGSMTGLLPRDRVMSSGRVTLDHPHLPFAFNFFDKERMSNKDQRRYEILTDMIMNCFVGEEKSYRVNCRALSNPEIISPELLNALHSPLDRVRFAVLRHDEKSVSPNSESKDRLYGSITNVLNQIRDRMAERNFFPAGYTREFVGTPWEMVTTRYIQPRSDGAALVYSVGTSEDIPPVIVRRHLAHKSGDLFDLTTRRDHLHPFARLSINYESRDDATRRIGHTQVILPIRGKKDNQIAVASNLADHYKSLITKYCSNHSPSLFSSTI